MLFEKFHFETYFDFRVNLYTVLYYEDIKTKTDVGSICVNYADNLSIIAFRIRNWQRAYFKLPTTCTLI